MKFWVEISRVEAIKALACIFAVDVIFMPFGFTKNTIPFAVRLPAIMLGSAPMTLFKTAALADGWMKLPVSF